MNAKNILLTAFALVCTSLCAQSWTTGTNLIYASPIGTKVGIGLSNPSELLHVNGGALKIGNSTSATDRSKNLLKFGNGAYVQLGEWEVDDVLSFKAKRYSFTNGNVGIGTNNATNKLEVNGTTATDKLLIAKPNAITDWNKLWQSGFYDGAGATNAPEPAEWFWGIHMGHRSNDSNYRYGGQIAVRNTFDNPKMFFRAVNADGNGIWKEVMTKERKLEYIEEITLNPTDNFTHDGRTVGHYSLNWGMDSWASGGPTAWLSSYGGIKFFTMGTPRLSIQQNGNIGIGTTNPGVKLDVAGTVRAHEVKVCLNQGCDYVFAPDYNLMPIEELSNFVSTHRHLPEVAPAAEMEANGIDLSEMNALLLKKVEELTLHVIELNKRIEVLENGHK